MTEGAKMRIFLTCFPTGSGSGAVRGSTPGGDVVGYALAEDGEGLCSHLSSSVEFSKHDMGLTSDWKHEIYTKKYPEGFELIWLDDAENDSRWIAAYKLNQEKKETDKKGEQT